MDKNIFEIAARQKLRFPYKGQISVEDLWDLSVTNLDTVFKALNAQVKQSREESLLGAKSAADEILDVQIEIVKHIVTVKLAEADEKIKAKEKCEQKQKIMELINEKKDEALRSMTAEQLQAMLDGMK